MAFWPVLEAEFLQWDDPSTLSQNPDLNPPTLTKVLSFWDWTQPRMDLYVPLTYTVWAGLASIARTPASGRGSGSGGSGSILDPRVFHGASLVLHLCAGVVVFLILRTILAWSGVDRARAIWPAGMGAALFLLHPIQVEAVAWASGLKDVLSGASAFLAVWLYLDWVDRGSRQKSPMKSNDTARARISSRLHFAGATVAFLFAVLAKPSAIVAPLVAGVLAVAFAGSHARRVSHLRRTLVPLSLWFVLALPLAIVARQAQPANVGFESPLWGRPIVALDALGFYLHKLVLPLDLGLDYGRSPDWLLGSRQAWFTWLVPVAVGLLVWLTRKRASWVTPAALVSIVSLLPVLGLVRFDFQRHSTVADHYVYVAMLGPALVFAFLASRRPLREQGAMAALVLVPLGFLTHIQTGYWHDTVSLMTHALEVNPASPAAHINLGHIAYSERRTAEAIQHYEAALAVRPEDLKAHNNLGNALLRMNRPAEALEHYIVTLKGQPDNPGIHYNLGNALGQLGRSDDAIREYEESLRLKPDDPKVHINLASVQLRLGHYEKAVEHYEEALRLEPGAADARRGLAEAVAAQNSHSH